MASEAGYNSSQCAYYWKEGMEGDYVNGVNWNVVYDWLDTSAGTECAIFYGADGKVAFDEFTEMREQYLAEQQLAGDALALSAKAEFVKVSNQIST